MSSLLRRALVDCTLKPNGKTWDCKETGWMHNTGRWVFMGVGAGVFVLQIVAFILWAKHSAKKRARKGLVPYVGTQWAYPKGYEVRMNEPFVPVESKRTAEAVEVGRFGGGG